MEGMESFQVPVRLLAQTLDLAEGHGVPRGKLLRELGLPKALREQLQAGTAPEPAPDTGMCERVRQRLDSCLPASLPGLQQMAGQLHVSPRTLKRHLLRQGTSYRRLLDERRAKACLPLLRQAGVTLDSIAEVLGYSSAANFTRAHRRWAGTTPGAHRAQLREGRH